MQVLDERTVVVTSSDEFKTALEEDNGYVYIYFGNDIVLESGFVINELKEKVIIDGTYLDNTYTYTNYLTDVDDVIKASSSNKVIVVKNMNIKSSHPQGVISVFKSEDYKNVKTVYSNVDFNGVELSYNQYGITKVLDSTITIENTNGVTAQRLGDTNNLIFGGDMTVNCPNTVFLCLFAVSASFTVLSNSRVVLTTTGAFFNGTPRLDFKVLRNSEFILTTGNGFAQTVNNGCQDVLIDENSKFVFMENNHQRVPMWNIVGNLVVNEGAILNVINSYENTPIDNYNIYFKGTDQSFVLNNPRNVTFYTKNANVFYTNNLVNFDFTFTRVNMWQDALDLSKAGLIGNQPDFSWYKASLLGRVKGTFENGSTTVVETNFDDSEMAGLPLFSNFVFQNRKVFSVGNVKTNIHPIDSTTGSISGHTLPNAWVKIVYLDVDQEVEADVDGMFSYDVSSIPDGTSVKVVTCSPDAFIYNTRVVVTPYDGELTLQAKTFTTSFVNTAISTNPTILSKKKSNAIMIVDSRKNFTSWNLYISYLNPMRTDDGDVLGDSLVFKKFDNDLVTLNTVSKLVYQSTKSLGDVTIDNLTFSLDKGLLLRLPSDDFVFMDEYFTRYIWEVRPGD